MHLGEISFCDKIGYNIKSDEYKKKILDDLYNQFGFKVVQKHFEKFSEQSITSLSRNPHLLTVRTNGNPYLLYLTKYNFANQCIFIDKKIQHGYFYPRMIIAKLWFDDDLFNDTLFDGEMVKTKDNSWEFLMYDMISERKMDMHKVNIIKRVNRIYEILSTMYKEDDVCCCKIRVKKYFTYDQLPYLLNEFIPSLNYSCRGIYFKPLYLKFKDILLNFDETLIKKVVRTKYKDINNSTFLTRDDVLTKERVIHEEPGSAGGSGASSADVSPCRLRPMVMVTCSNVEIITTLDDNTQKQFYVKKTSQPDIYELFSTEGSMNDQVEIACVPDLKTSKMLRLEFTGANLTEKKLFTCRYSQKFSKWIPINPGGGI